MCIMSCRMPRRKTLANIKAELLQQNLGWSVGYRETFSGFVLISGEGCIFFAPANIVLPVINTYRHVFPARLSGFLFHHDYFFFFYKHNFFCQLQQVGTLTWLRRMHILAIVTAHVLCRFPADERPSTRAEPTVKRGFVLHLP